MLSLSRAVLLLCSTAAFVSAPVAAQPTTPDASTFAPGYFARSQPASAYDMVLLLPGFRLQEGDAEVRGYSGAGGNILIDGQRPSSKQETLEDQLKRVPAGSVARIELIRSGRAGVDMQGYALVANVVRSSGATLRGRLEAEYAHMPKNDFGEPRIAAQLSYGGTGSMLDLSGAIYRDIDDEHGTGSRNRYAPDGSPIWLNTYSQPEGDTVKEASAAYRRDALGGTLRVNGVLKDTRMFADIGQRITYPAPVELIGTERNHTRATEAGLQFERPLNAHAKLELIGIRRDTALTGKDTSISPDEIEISMTNSDSSETILRGVLRHQGEAVSIEAGAEGAINVLDSHSGLTQNGLVVIPPGANVRVEEKRAEFFGIATWNLSPRLSLETGLRYETSRLAQSGDSNLVKPLSFLKPRMLLSWAPGETDDVRLLVERAVGQLDFADFVSETSLTSGTFTAGNADLEPYRLWRAELAYEHRFGSGSVVLTGRREWISDVVDRVPIEGPSGIFDAVGNIGKGRRTQLQADFNLPLDTAGLKGVTLQSRVLYTNSRVRDPATGLERRISEDKPLEGFVKLTHDIPAAHLRWGINYELPTISRANKIDEIQTDRAGGRLDVFVEYKPTPRWTARLFAKNLTDNPTTRTREIYAGVRGASALRLTEQRVLRSGPYAGLNVQWSFGG